MKVVCCVLHDIPDGLTETVIAARCFPKAEISATEQIIQRKGARHHLSWHSDSTSINWIGLVTTPCSNVVSRRWEYYLFFFFPVFRFTS